MIINLNIESKTLEGLKKSIIVLNKVFKLNEFGNIGKIRSLESKKSRITVLRSPHVNKTSQKHFEILSYSKNVLIHSNQIWMFATILKRINLNLLSDSKINLKVTLNKKRSLKLYNSQVRLSNYTPSKNYQAQLKNLNVRGEISLVTFAQKII